MLFLKIKDSFHTYAIITIIFWSMAFVFTRLALHYFSAFSLGFLRYAFATCALIVIAFITKMKLPKKEDIKWFVLSGLFGFFLYMIAFNKGCESVTSATGSAVLAIVPVITAMLARKNGCEAIITGESLAQVASQTLSALICTDCAVDMPVLRPLIGFDKTEITALARSIGTFELSILPFEDCCTIFTPQFPKTHPKLEQVLAIEAAMADLPRLEQEAADAAEKILTTV